MNRTPLWLQLLALAVAGYALYEMDKPRRLHKREANLRAELRALERADQEERTAARHLAAHGAWTYFVPQHATA